MSDKSCVNSKELRIIEMLARRRTVNFIADLLDISKSKVWKLGRSQGLLAKKRRKKR